MPFSKANREPLRCINPECRSVLHGGPDGGRVLLETAKGVVFKESGGDKLAVLGMWLWAECGKCGSRRFNPDMVAFDGMGEVFAKTMDAAASRVDKDLAEDAPPAVQQPDSRRRLRRIA